MAERKQFIHIFMVFDVEHKLVPKSTAQQIPVWATKEQYVCDLLHQCLSVIVSMHP
jgi:hypothetical protein